MKTLYIDCLGILSYLPTQVRDNHISKYYNNLSSEAVSVKPTIKEYHIPNVVNQYYGLVLINNVVYWMFGPEYEIYKYIREVEFHSHIETVSYINSTISFTGEPIKWKFSDTGESVFDGYIVNFHITN